MDKSQLAAKVKAFRIQKGMSQESLAEESGLSLRTIQRIENGETKPTGDSIQRLTNALGINPDDIMDWSIKEDQKSLTNLNLSALTFLLFPLLGIIIPFVIWSSKKGKIKNIDKTGKELINFQITWTMLLFLAPILMLIIAKIGLVASMSFSIIFIVIGVLYVFNLFSILINTARLSNDKQVVYWPQLRFLR